MGLHIEEYAELIETVDAVNDNFLVFDDENFVISTNDNLQGFDNEDAA